MDHLSLVRFDIDIEGITDGKDRCDSLGIMYVNILAVILALQPLVSRIIEY